LVRGEPYASRPRLQRRPHVKKPCDYRTVTRDERR